MSLSEVHVEGTLNQDGTLHLDTKPNLSPGRVQVVLRPGSQTSTAPGNWWQFMQAARREMEVAGCGFLDDRAMKEQVDWLREEDRIDEMLRESAGS